MNTHKNYLQACIKSLQRLCRQNADTIAGIACGALFGVVFMTAVSIYHAKQVVNIPPLVETPADIVEPVASSSSVSMSIESVPTIENTNAITESRSSVSSASSVAVPVVLKVKPKTVITVRKPVEKTHPAAVLSERSTSPVKASLIALEEPDRSSASSSSSAVTSSEVSNSSSRTQTIESSSSQASLSASSSVTMSSSVSASSSSSSISSTTPESVIATTVHEDFPAFERAVFPISKTPNWGNMHDPMEWNRKYSEMKPEDFVRVPRYDLQTLTIPMASLTSPFREENVPTITAKLFYSTRFLGSYDLDAGERVGKHTGVDLKLARGTPVGAIGGGRVVTINRTKILGIHVIIEHRLKNGETYFSIYGHFDSTAVTAGQDVKPGQTVGYVGLTGNTSAPHLHLQVDKGQAGEDHTPIAEGDNIASLVNPITFISTWSSGG